MRFAIIATPRAGNSVLRKTISAAYGLQEFGGHDPRLLEGDLPDGSIFQVHARYSPELHRSLTEQGVIIVTPTRHPLDTLLSMLHFAQFEPEVNHWLGGNYLTELEGCDPSSRAFRTFATGEGAHELLGVSLGWWPHADVAIRYCDFNEDPTVVLERPEMPEPRLTRHHPSVRDSGSFARFHSAPNMHGWLGQPGYWQHFIPTSLVKTLYSIHQPSFDIGHYDISDSEELTPQQIRSNWAAAFAGREENARRGFGSRLTARSQHASNKLTGATAAAAGAAGTAGLLRILG
jgi:hypothetical protein